MRNRELRKCLSQDNVTFPTCIIFARKNPRTRYIGVTRAGCGLSAPNELLIGASLTKRDIQVARKSSVRELSLHKTDRRLIVSSWHRNQPQKPPRAINCMLTFFSISTSINCNQAAMNYGARVRHRDREFLDPTSPTDLSLAVSLFIANPTKS